MTNRLKSVGAEQRNQRAPDRQPDNGCNDGLVFADPVRETLPYRDRKGAAGVVDEDEGGVALESLFHDPLNEEEGEGRRHVDRHDEEAEADQHAPEGFVAPYNQKTRPQRNSVSRFGWCTVRHVENGDGDHNRQQKDCDTGNSIQRVSWSWPTETNRHDQGDDQSQHQADVTEGLTPPL